MNCVDHHNILYEDLELFMQKKALDDLSNDYVDLHKAHILRACNGFDGAR